MVRFPSKGQFIKYGITTVHLILIAGDVSLGPMTTILEYKWS